jgi:DNA-binding response OmpR family regulator
MWETFAPSTFKLKRITMPSDRPYRVFVVEDEPLITMVIEDAVQAVGCEMVGPFTGLGEALEGASTGIFDCAILDVNIRDGLSYPVAISLVERGFPILLATGYRSTSFPEELAQEPYLAKPYSSAQLEHELRELCNRVRSRSTAREPG